MANHWALLILIAVFGSSVLLGGASAWLLVKWTERALNRVFAVPFTLWWLVAGLSVAVHLCGVRVSIPGDDSPSPSAVVAPLTPRSTLPLDVL